MPVRNFYLLLALLSLCACSADEDIECNKFKPLDLANWAAKDCFEGGNCTLDMRSQNEYIVGQLGFIYYEECGLTIKLLSTVEYSDRNEFIYRCYGEKYGAELRVTVLNKRSKSFGCAVSHLNFFLVTSDPPLGSITTTNINLIE